MMLGLGFVEWSILLVPFALSTMAIVSVLRNEFSGNGKLIWALVVLFVPLGTLLYFFIGYGQRIKSFDRKVSHEI